MPISICAAGTSGLWLLRKGRGLVFQLTLEELDRLVATSRQELAEHAPVALRVGECSSSRNFGTPVLSRTASGWSIAAHGRGELLLSEDELRQIIRIFLATRP